MKLAGRWPDGYRYKDGKKLTLELATTTRQDRKDLAVVLQDQLKKIGIDIQPKYLNSIYFLVLTVLIGCSS